MVKNMGYIDNFTGKVWDWTKPFQRTGKFPLDRSSIFESYEDALKYAKGDGSDSRGLGATSYIGQTITVWGLNEKGKDGVWVYSLVPHTPVDENDTALADLKPVGSTTTETAETYSAAVTLSAGLVVGQLILVASEETVDEQTYKAGFYIVNAPGSISALDTSTGASDEIGAISNRVAALEGNRVLKSDFEEYQGTVETALDVKVDDSDFETYKEEVSGALDAKVDDSDFETYKEEVSGNLDTKVSNDDFEEYQGTVGTALDAKVDDSDFETYKEEVSGALDAKVDDSDFETYKGGVTEALNEKATIDSLNALETKVDGDIQNLTNLLGDYSGTLGDVDDRLTDLETFVKAHESIQVSDIENLFSQSNE